MIAHHIRCIQKYWHLAFHTNVTYKEKKDSSRALTRIRELDQTRKRKQTVELNTSGKKLEEVGIKKK